tara:strand:+ start:979 stop:2037 length:1059 start_codon:yes stop_codon:yes gene_type:complete
MDNIHLAISNLSHNYSNSYQNNFILKSINLNINRGELIGLLGPSGCGKTTLLRLIAGFESPSSGLISLDGEIISRPKNILPPEKRGVGMVFQDYALFPHLDVWSNVCFGIQGKQKKERAFWLLDVLGLSDFKFRYPHELSGGQKQRLALARALAPGNSLILLDEPFSSLDVDVRNMLRSELKSVLNTCSATAILVTHDPQEALAICDRVAVMQSGQLEQCSKPTELIDKPNTSFVGRFVLQRNVLPINYLNSKAITEIGDLNLSLEATSNQFSEIQFDDKSITLKQDVNGSFVVQSKEFNGSEWVIKTKSNKSSISVWQPYLSNVKVGDRCSLKFLPGKKGIVFPGCVDIYF